MVLKNVFGEIKTYNRNRHLDGPPECGVTAATTLRYSMPVAAVVHTITSDEFAVAVSRRRCGGGAVRWRLDRARQRNGGALPSILGETAGRRHQACAARRPGR